MAIASERTAHDASGVSSVWSPRNPAGTSGFRCRFCGVDATRLCQVAGFVCDKCEEVVHRLVKSPLPT